MKKIFTFILALYTVFAIAQAPTTCSLDPAFLATNNAGIWPDSATNYIQGTVGLPYELAEAVKNSPVKLYTTASCAPCDNGRKLLNARGIPFTEKVVSTKQDIEVISQITGDAQLPILTVGRNKQKGFEAGAWNAALTYAGYPASNQLPKNYSNGNVESAATVAKAATENQSPKTESASAQTPSIPSIPAAGNAPPGFRF